MDPSKQQEAATALNDASRSQASDASDADDDAKSDTGDNQHEAAADESKDAMARKGAVGRRFAVVELPGGVGAPERAAGT